MKRIITQLVLLTAMLCVSVQAHAYDCIVDGIYYNLNSTDKTAEVTNGTDKYTGDITIPEAITYEGSSYSVTSIGNNAFGYCKKLTSIEIPNSVTSIGDWAFSNCTGLTSVTIPNSVTSIGDYALECCSGLTSIVVEKGNTKYDSRDNCNAIIETATNTLISGCQNTIIPNSVTSIGWRAFSWCTGLTSVTIPNSVTSIDELAFAGCTGLTSVTIGNSVTSIGWRAFFGCTGLTSVTIPEKVTSIDECVFYGCTGLTSVTIPNSVTSIGDEAFRGCTGLTSVTIPEKVTSIDECAFYNCTGLTSVTCLASNPPACGEKVFVGIDNTNCTLYVLQESVQLYKVADQWKDFVKVEGLLGVDDITVDGEDAETLYDVYNMQGVKVGSGLRRADMNDALPRGVYILVSPQGTSKEKI